MKITQIFPGPEPDDWTPRAKRVLQDAVMQAMMLHHNYVGAEHILLALLKQKDGLAAKILGDTNLTEEKVKDFIMGRSPDSKINRG